MNPGFSALLVVKIGGSLASGSQLRGWLQALEAASNPCVIVPGGGPFADAVRTAQGAIGFDDRAAHEMALLAMAQYGVALASLCHRGMLVEYLPEIFQALETGRPEWKQRPQGEEARNAPQDEGVVSGKTHHAPANRALPIWSPAKMALANASIPASWDVTSDSLAAWLAGVLGAKDVLLVKQANPKSQQLLDLARDGIIDPAFGGFLARSGAAGWIAGPADLPTAAQKLIAGDIPGQRIQLPPNPDLA